MPIVLLAFFFMVGVCMAATAGVGMLEAKRRRAWPTAQGTVLNGEVLEQGGDDDGSSHFTGVVRYRYAFQPATAYRGGSGSQHDGRLESKTTQSRADAEAFVRAHPPGERVEVRFDPSRPSRSFLGAPPTETGFDARLALAGLAISASSLGYALLG